MPEIDLIELQRPEARLDLALPTAELILNIGMYRETQTLGSIMRAMEDRTTVIALDDDQVVGTAGLSIDKAGLGSVEDVISDPERRGDGIGRKVVEAVERLAVREKLLELSLSSSLLAMTFYEHLGYQDYGDGVYRKSL